VAAGEQAMQNINLGRPVTEGLGQAYAQGIVGTGVPMAGHQALRAFATPLAGRQGERAILPPVRDRRPPYEPWKGPPSDDDAEQSAAPPDAQDENQSGPNSRIVIPSDDPYTGKALGSSVEPIVSDPYRGKDLQRGERSGDDPASQLSDPWFANVARRSSDDGASGAAAQVYPRTKRPPEPAADRVKIWRADDSAEPPREAASEPEDEADRWEDPKDEIRHLYKHEDTRFGLHPTREELLRDSTGLGVRNFEGRVIMRPTLMNIKGLIYGDNRKLIGGLERTMYPDLGTLERVSFPELGHAVHNGFHLFDENQGQGVARDILAHNIDWYGRNGINFVHLHAKEWGAYAWAKYGFVPKTSSWPRLQFNIAARLAYLRLKGVVSDTEYNKIQELLASRNPKSLWEIADNTTRVLALYVRARGRLYTTLGKALLYNQKWNGKLDLRDNQTMDRFHEYISQRR
jgi:hypothetical protein